MVGEENVSDVGIIVVVVVVVVLLSFSKLKFLKKLYQPMLVSYMWYTSAKSLYVIIHTRTGRYWVKK